MIEAYVGIDLAFRKNKRLPIVVCTMHCGCLEPLRLRTAAAKPPIGEGNARILDNGVVERFVNEAAGYIRCIEREFGVGVRRIAIDAPSNPKANGTRRRACELGLDTLNIRYISTPSVEDFGRIRNKATDHLALGGDEAKMPGANQLWMLVGFELFKRLRPNWECIEVFPQAIVTILDAHRVHKRHRDGLLAQLSAAAVHTGWPVPAEVERLNPIAYGAHHDRLDAYLSAWVASLDECDRKPIGCPPDDAIWIPRFNS